jgi:hypothetical protein
MRRLAALVLIAAGQSPAPRPVALPAPEATLAAEFTLVTSVRELPDGRVLVLDRTDKKLGVVDWKTSALTPIGRNGSGPGEYAQPTTLLALGGDSTLMPDPRNGRWLLLSGASIVATIGADAPALKNGGRQPNGADARGHVIATGAISRGAATPVPRRDSILLLRLQRTTGKADTMAVMRARPATINIQGPADRPTSVQVLQNPLGAGELAALFPDGWIAVARIEPYRVDWIAPDGKQIRGQPLPFERVRLDLREQRAYLAREAARTGTTPRDPSSLPDWPESMPAFQPGALLTAPDGRLWIRRTGTAADPSPPYDVIDRRGALVARVMAGADVTVVGFGRAAIYTMATDDNGVQRLQRRSSLKF